MKGGGSQIDPPRKNYHQKPSLIRVNIFLLSEIKLDDILSLSQFILDAINPPYTSLAERSVVEA